MEKENIILEIKDKIAFITLDRPARLHAFNDVMFDLLEKITLQLRNALPRAVIITGSGYQSFSAGFDVKPDNPMVQRIMDAIGTKDHATVNQAISHIRHVVDSFVSLPVPIIAAVNGNAHGGGAELAVRCDLRVMSDEAYFRFSEAKLGLMTDWGGGAALVRLVGSSKAADLLLTARRVFADEAMRIGLVNRVVHKESVLKEAIEIAAQIAENGPNAVRHMLALVRNGRNVSFDASLQEEEERAVSLILSGECFHGVSAFLESKKPEFPDV